MKKVTTASAETSRPLIFSTSRLRLRTLTFIRWIAVLGQVLAVAVAQALLGFNLPLVPVSVIIGVLALLNFATALRHRGTTWLSDRPARLYLACDLLQLLALLSLTGGLQNPFSVLVLAPVVVSAATLSRRSTVFLVLLAIIGIGLLSRFHLPLYWGEGPFTLPPLYILGILVALLLAVVFTAAYVSSLSLEARRLSDALGATQLALAREQRMAALGGLAAAAAHELGSPLATISVIARELERELPPELPADHPLREDMALLRGEAERCRRILAELANRPDSEEDSPYHRLPLSALIEAAAQPYRCPGVKLDIRPQSELGGQPLVPRLPEVLQASGLLLQNALQFAERQVEVELSWSESTAWITIRDDGPGFDENILGNLGEPYISTGRRGRDEERRDRREEDGEEHMGLGIFIARTLLAHVGASVIFRNRPEGGAEVVIEWPLHHREIEADRL